METGRISDCEAVVEGWLGQPSNSLSSLAYLIAALAVVVAVKRHGHRVIGYVLAGSLGLVGLGSLLTIEPALNPVTCCTPFQYRSCCYPPWRPLSSPGDKPSGWRGLRTTDQSGTA